jgi:hypothetical protein
MDGEALANPPFRWIVWAAAHAGANIQRPLLFNLLAFTKYFDILVYMKDNPTGIESKSITVDHFRKFLPEDDSAAGVADPLSGRPTQEISSTMKGLNNVFTNPSIWRLVQLLHGKGLGGTSRRITSSCILHASVGGRISRDQMYGGKRRGELQAAEADEAITIPEGFENRFRSVAGTSHPIIGGSNASEISGVGSRSLDRASTPSSGPLSLRVNIISPVSPSKSPPCAIALLNIPYSLPSFISLPVPAIRVRYLVGRRQWSLLQMKPIVNC